MGQGFKDSHVINNEIFFVDSWPKKNGIFKLLAPSSLLESQNVLQNSFFLLILIILWLIVIRKDFNVTNILFRYPYSLWLWVDQAHLELLNVRLSFALFFSVIINTLLVFGLLYVIINILVDKLNFNDLLTLLMLELNWQEVWNVVLEFMSCLGRVLDAFHLIHAADFTIATVLSHDFQLEGLSVLLFDLHFSNLESDNTWVVFVNNGNNGLGVISLESWLLFFVGVVEFDVEIFVWFPNVVVVNSNLNRSVLLGSLHGHDLVNRVVVILGDSISLDSSDTEVNFLVNVLLNNYLNESTTFCD